ncbi:MAG: adenine deaminase [Methanothrix sp.]|uniref:adenine deaminase n=1 Tax=Methanothrix sp. TaxID=90426 RepID=UPI0019A606F6|nr:adenine deaminase [Methanothrix sp.]MBC7080305.1 adenine deaminase [Methanothrix sp.]NPU87662.1 adenine deaminase [Methanothrix sp.]
MRIEDLIAAARGELEADLLLEGGKLVNVFSGEIHRADISIYGGFVAGFDCPSARRVISVEDHLIAPGFIDAHVHIESSMLMPSEYARAVVPRGTLTVIADPHEIANVLGVDGISYLLRCAEGIPMRFLVTAPSCVPATHLETSGAALGVSEIASLLDDHRVVGLGEMMNYPGVIHRDKPVLAKLKVAASKNKTICGHAPGLGGRDLHAYAAALIEDDHECTRAEEAMEQLRAGICIMIREGSAARNLDELVKIIREYNTPNIMLCTDDLDPRDIVHRHIDHMIRRIIEAGTDPVAAIQMATINPARHFGLRRTGAVAPGYRADIIVMDHDFNVRRVIFEGEEVARDGRLTASFESKRLPVQSSMNVRLPITRESFRIPATGRIVRVIGVAPNQILTETIAARPEVRNGEVISDTRNDILKVAVVERHRATGNVGLGLVSGFGLKRGAIASSVSHDSHNIIVVGEDEESMVRAVESLISMGGGWVSVDGTTIASLPLPIAGLLSERRVEDVVEEAENVIAASHSLGSELEDSFMTLSFLALPVIPELRITDRGLVDVREFGHVPLFME